MEYQTIINLLDNTTDQHSRFRTRNWVEINDESRGKYDNSSIIFKTPMIRSDLCAYSDTYRLTSRTITITGAGDDDNAKRIDEKYRNDIKKLCTIY